jgi:hypothetical protein
MFEFEISPNNKNLFKSPFRETSQWININFLVYGKKIKKVVGFIKLFIFSPTIRVGGWQLTFIFITRTFMKTDVIPLLLPRHYTIDHGIKIPKTYSSCDPANSRPHCTMQIRRCIILALV